MFIYQYIILIVLVGMLLYKILSLDRRYLPPPLVLYDCL